MDIRTLFFFALLIILAIIFIVAVISAIIGYFSKDQDIKDKYFIRTSQLLLIFALVFVVGFGSCYIVANTTNFTWE